MKTITPESVQARQDRALLFAPEREIRVIRVLFWPIAVMGISGLWIYFFGPRDIAAVLAGLTIAALIITWGAFIRILTSRTDLPASLLSPDGGTPPPLRFRPEIAWRTLWLTRRFLLLLIAVLLVSYTITALLEGWDDMIDTSLALLPLFLGAALASALTTIPSNALELSQYGLVDWSAEQRDRGMPKALLARRNAAVAALLDDYPAASVRERRQGKP